MTKFSTVTATIALVIAIVNAIVVIPPILDQERKVKEFQLSMNEREKKNQDFLNCLKIKYSQNNPDTTRVC
jgi:hypothetical protein